MRKTPFAIALLIFAIAIAIYWQDRQHLENLKERHAELVVETQPSARALDSENSNEEIHHSSRTQKLSRERDNQAISKILQSYQESVARRRQGNALEKSPDYSITELTGTQLKMLIAQALESRELSKECLGFLLDDAVFMLAKDDPQAALALLDRIAGLFTDTKSARWVVQVSMSRLSKEDPEIAAQWIKNHNDQFPQLITNEDKLCIIAQAATRNPKLAFSLYRELDIKDSQNAFFQISSAAKSEEHLNATVAALREHLVHVPETKRKETLDNAMFQFAAGLANSGFDKASQGIESAKLTSEEFDALTRVLGVFYREGQNADNGKWLEWLGNHLSAKEGRASIEGHMESWTNDDPEAAGKWLAAAPDSPARNAAIRGYAKTVSKCDPEAAVQWALTLPPGEDREQTLRRIHASWPKEDAAAREAFAKQHGIE